MSSPQGQVGDVARVMLMKGTMAMSGLTKRYRLREHTPKLRTVVSTPWCDRVLVHMLLTDRTRGAGRSSSPAAGQLTVRR